MPPWFRSWLRSTPFWVALGAVNAVDTLDAASDGHAWTAAATAATAAWCLTYAALRAE